METDLAILGIEIEAIGLDKTLKGLDKLSAKGQETQRGFEQLNLAPLAQNLSQTEDGTADYFDDLLLQGRRTATDLNGILGRAFDRFFLEGREAGSVLKSLEKDLLRLGSQVFTGSSQSASGGVFSSLTSVAGDLLSSFLPGYANGGQFTVGGAAGQDRNLVGLRLSRGERVTVETPAQQKQNPQNGQSQNINLAFNITTPDAQSFRLSQNQIQGEALRAAQRVLNRNGSSS